MDNYHNYLLIKKMSHQANLNKANQLLKEISSIDKNFSPITLNDFPLFEKFFQKEPHTYGNSWTYITQGMYGTGLNNLGYKYYDGKNLSAVTIYPKLEQPNTIVFYWIRPMGSTILNIINHFSKNLLKTKGIPTYVKKIFKDQYNFLLKQDFKPIESFPWHSLCLAEDDTYPERIINVKKTINLARKAKKGSKIRRAFQYYRHYLKKDQIITSSIFQKKEDVKKVLANFFSHQRKLNKPNVSRETDFFNLLIENPKVNSILENLFYLNNKPVGFFYAEIQNKNFASLYATITNRKLANHLTEYIMFYLIDKLNNLGINFLNLGGSETQTLDNFKNKFLPETENKMYWAVLK